MREELEQKLMDDFPFMEVKSFVDGERLGCPIICECQDGWFKLIYSMCKEIDELYKAKGKDVNELNIEQIKEKFGRLRIYMGNYIEGVNEIIERYERLSENTCERCGKLGEIRGKSWVQTLCNECV